MHQALGIGLVICLIAFAFGETAARIVVGFALLVSLAFFAYICVRVVSGTI